MGRVFDEQTVRQSQSNNTAPIWIHNVCIDTFAKMFFLYSSMAKNCYLSLFLVDVVSNVGVSFFTSQFMYSSLHSRNACYTLYFIDCRLYRMLGCHLLPFLENHKVQHQMYHHQNWHQT